MKIGPNLNFPTPKDWTEVHDRIATRNPEERKAFIEVAVMVWNMAADITNSDDHGDGESLFPVGVDDNDPIG